MRYEVRNGVYEGSDSSFTGVYRELHRDCRGKIPENIQEAPKEQG